MLTLLTPRPAHAALLCLPLYLGTPALAQDAEPMLGELGPGIAARGQDAVLTIEEFDELSRRRHAMSETGRAALKHLLRARLLDQLARESKFQVSEAELEARWAEVARQVKEAGEADGIEGYLRQNHVEPATFREFLRLGMVQETLSRRALGIPPDRAVPADQQEMWLDQIIEQRGTDLPLGPWEGLDSVVGRVGNLEVTLAEFLPHLRSQISIEDVRADCYQLLLMKKLADRMPDLSDEALQRSIDRELERRRLEFLADPTHQGITFDQVMTAKGMPPAVLRQDPAVVIGAFSQLWLERTYGEDGLREAYRAERELFDGRFGEAIEVSVIFLRAAVMSNQITPRTYEDAELELARMAEEIDTLVDFQELARARSEDTNSRAAGGNLGWLTRQTSGAPKELLGVAFANPGVGLQGPIRIGPGVLLAWIGEQRPAPAWEAMRGHVSNELRRRFLEEALPLESVVTWMEVQ